VTPWVFDATLVHSAIDRFLEAKGYSIEDAVIDEFEAELGEIDEETVWPFSDL
jgi:hypothetical protein